MIQRTLAKKLKDMAKKIPALAIVGPRQSGKTTLARALFPKHNYISLENITQRNFALSDPERFLEEARSPRGMILDEFQQAPQLLSYIQGIIDEEKKPGYFILTGSQNFLMNQAISQTLAGRITIKVLLPLSINELKTEGLLPSSYDDLLFKGSYPRIFDEKLKPLDWYSDYIKTYVERDIRQLQNIESISMFQDFVGLCAGRIGQLLNITSLANDCGISDFTARSWLSLLEASYILFLLKPHHKNFNKRIVKSPKLYFYDTGLACSFLGIESSDHLMTHYARGHLFENLIISDLMKAFYNQGRIPPLYFWRDKSGHEVDCIIERAAEITAIEIKSGKTIQDNFFKDLLYWAELTKSDPEKGFIVYGGDDQQQRSKGFIVSWQDIGHMVTKSLTKNVK